MSDYMQDIDGVELCNRDRVSLVVQGNYETQGVVVRRRAVEYACGMKFPPSVTVQLDGNYPTSFLTFHPDSKHTNRIRKIAHANS